MSSGSLRLLQVLRLAVPVMLSQAAIAATGIVDTVVIGVTGDKAQLAAVGIAAIGFNFL